MAPNFSNPGISRRNPFNMEGLMYVRVQYNNGENILADINRRFVHLVYQHNYQQSPSSSLLQHQSWRDVTFTSSREGARGAANDGGDVHMCNGVIQPHNVPFGTVFDHPRYDPRRRDAWRFHETVFNLIFLSSSYVPLRCAQSDFCWGPVKFLFHSAIGLLCE